MPSEGPNLNREDAATAFREFKNDINAGNTDARVALSKSCDLPEYDDLADIWKDHVLPKTYWVFLIDSELTETDEAINSLLHKWAIIRRPQTTKILFLVSGNCSKYALVKNRLNCVDLPCLIVSKSESLVESLIFDPEILRHLHEKKGHFSRLLTKLENMLTNSDTAKDILECMGDEDFWRNISSAPSEEVSLCSRGAVRLYESKRA